MSLFELAEEPQAHVGNITDATFVKVDPTRSIPLGAAFGSSLTTFKWEPGRGQWWVPSRSFFRIRIRTSLAKEMLLTNQVNDPDFVKYTVNEVVRYGKAVEDNNGIMANEEFTEEEKAKLLTDLKIGGKDFAIPPVTRCLYAGDAFPFSTCSQEIAHHPALGLRPAWNMAGNMFSQAKFSIGTTVISEVVTYLPQVDAYKARTTQSYAHRMTSSSTTMRTCLGAGILEREIGLYTVGNAPATYGTRNANIPVGYTHDPTGGDTRLSELLGAQPDFGYVPAYPDNTMTALITENDEDRAYYEAIPGFDAIIDDVKLHKSGERPAQTSEFTWVPPLSIFDHQGALPGSAFKVDLTGNPSFENDMWDQSRTLGGLRPLDLNPYEAASTWLKTDVLSIVFFACMVEGPDGSDSKYVLDLHEYKATATDVRGGRATTGFDVPSTTRSVGFAFQTPHTDYTGGPSVFRTNANLAINRVRAPIDFQHSWGNTSLTDIKFHPERADWMTEMLDSWHLAYDGKNYPPEHSEQTPGHNVFTLKQRWHDSQLQCGLATSPGGAEPFAAWMREGPIYTVSWPRQTTATATRLNLSTNVLQGIVSQDSYASTPNYKDSLLFLFTRYAKTFLVRTSDSRACIVETPVATRHVVNEYGQNHNPNSTKRIRLH